MFHLSRDLYADLTAALAPRAAAPDRERLLRACERAVERLCADPHYFADPVTTTFRDVRHLFPLARLPTVRRTIEAHLEPLGDRTRNDPDLGLRLAGVATTCGSRRSDGLPCQRPPLAGSDRCPSHPHAREVAHAA